MAKRNSEKSPHSTSANPLTPKTGYITDLSSTDLTEASGRELGFHAHSARARSAQSLLEFCGYVSVAYERYYAPWKQVGRKASKRTKEAKFAEAQWQDFLTELGWQDFSRYQKQIRDCAEIGRRVQILQPHSAELPSTVSALSALCKSAKTDKQLEKFATQCSPETTAAQVKQLFLPKTVASTQVEEDQASDDEVTVLGCELLLRPESTEANAAVLALLFALEMNEESLGEGTSVKGLESIDAGLAKTVEKYIDSDAIKALVALYDERLSSSVEAQAAKKAKSEENEAVNSYHRETIDRLHPKKKRDFSKLKV